MPCDADAVLSPCIGVCRLDAHGFCIGCHRDMKEISTWASLDDEDRRCLMEEVLPSRALARESE